MSEKNYKKIMNSAESAFMYFGMIYLMLPVQWNKVQQAVCFVTCFVVGLLKEFFFNNKKSNP